MGCLPDLGGGRSLMGGVCLRGGVFLMGGCLPEGLVSA